MKLQVRNQWQFFLTSQDKGSLMFVCTKNSILGSMVRIIDVFHQNLFWMSFNKLGWSMGLSTWYRSSKSHLGFLSFQTLY